MTRDVPIEHRYEKARYLGSGIDLDGLLYESGIFDVDAPVNGPVAGACFLDVKRNSGFSSANTTVVQKALEKASGVEYVRVYDETGGWSLWGALPAPSKVVESTTAASPTDTPLDVADGYEHRLTTAGSQAAENASLEDGTVVGQRILVVLDTLTDPSDTVVLDGGNIQRVGYSGETPLAVVTITFDAADEYALLEWDGDANWNALYTTATVAAT